MKNLPEDYSRCYGTRCHRKSFCARYTSLPPGEDAKKRTVYTDFSLLMLCCAMFEDNEELK